MVTSVSFKSRGSLTVLVVCSLIQWGCQKKCQPPSQEAFKSFVDQEWRLVETTNPQIRDLTNTNFIIMTFGINFTGQVFKVVNNDRFDNPVLVFKYNVDPEQKLIRAVYSTPPPEGQEGETQTQSAGSPTEYFYKLGRGFELTETRTGFYYRMVPFAGVVKPDEKCIF